MCALNWMQWATTNDAGLKVQAAMIYVAADIVNEEPTAPNHATKMVAARKILNGQVDISHFTKLVATDQELRGIIDEPREPTDQELLQAVQRSLLILAKVSF